MEIVRWGMERGDHEIQLDAMEELVRRGDGGAIAALANRIALLVFDQDTWLGGDKESLPRIRAFLEDREPWVREAAKEALSRLEKTPKAAEPDPDQGKKGRT